MVVEPPQLFVKIKMVRIIVGTPLRKYWKLTSSDSTSEKAMTTSIGGKYTRSRGMLNKKRRPK